MNHTLKLNGRKKNVAHIDTAIRKFKLYIDTETPSKVVAGRTMPSCKFYSMINKNDDILYK